MGHVHCCKITTVCRLGYASLPDAFKSVRHDKAFFPTYTLLRKPLMQIAIQDARFMGNWISLRKIVLFSGMDVGAGWFISERYFGRVGSQEEGLVTAY